MCVFVLGIKKVVQRDPLPLCRDVEPAPPNVLHPCYPRGGCERHRDTSRRNTTGAINELDRLPSLINTSKIDAKNLIDLVVSIFSPKAYFFYLVG